MDFRYQDSRGKVISLPDVASLLQAIQNGALTPESPFSLGQHGSWQRADSVAAYQQAAAGLAHRPAGSHGPSLSEPPQRDVQTPAGIGPWHTRRAVRVGLGMALVASVLLLGVWRLRYLDRERATETARAVDEAAGPSLDAQHQLVVLTAEFGDSTGVAIRRAEDWFKGQRVGSRLRGPLLKNAASLRSVRAAAARVRGKTDSLVAQSAALAEFIRARADSLEAVLSKYDGLLMRLEEALESWKRDIAEYAGLEYGFAATLDSIAAFLLERPGAFAITEGRAAFLSRADAIRFDDLNDQLGVLTGRKKAWADGIFSRRPTWMTALALFRSVRFGCFLGEDTAFRHIKLLPPDALFEWDGRLTVGERRPRPIGAPLDIGREEALREYARLLREAVERRLPAGDFALPLSGGRDSRHILFALLELGRPPAFCATLARKFPPIENDDLQVAQALARRLELPHRTIPQLPRFQAELRSNVECHFLSDENAWYVAVGDHLRDAGLPALDGLGGDVFSTSWWQTSARLALYRAGRLDELADNFLARLPLRIHSDSPFLRSKETRALAHERVVQELERSAAAPNPLSMFGFWSYIRKEVSLLPFGICAGVTCLCPFLDCRLYDFAVSLPPEVTLGGKFGEDAIAAAYPRFADFPYATKGRGRRLQDSLSLAARVGWYGLQGDPRRSAGWARAVGRMALDNLLPAYHAGHIVDGPAWHLYRWQLEDLRRGNLPIRP